MRPIGREGNGEIAQRGRSLIPTIALFSKFLTARRYASAALAVIVCLSVVRPSICHTPVLYQNG